MIKKQVERTGPEQIFIVGRNTSNATISQNCPVYFEHDAVTDGNAVSQCSALIQGVSLFAGITDEKMADDAYGLVQVYGYRASCQVSCASGAETEVGLALLPFKSEDFMIVSSSDSVNAFKGVVIMETVAANAAASVPADRKVMIRAL